MQGDWTVCVPLKYLILVLDIQEAKCSEFTVQTSKKCIGFQELQKGKLQYNRVDTNFLMTDNFVKCTLPIKSMPDLIIPIVLILLFKFCPPPSRSS